MKPLLQALWLSLVLAVAPYAWAEEPDHAIHEELRGVLRRVLESSGYHVEVAENGAAGLDRVRRARVDVIILDIDMPIMNGRAFLAARAADTALLRIPVVVYSADPQPAAVPAGISAWIWKGTEVSELLQALSTHHAR